MWMNYYKEISEFYILAWLKAKTRVSDEHHPFMDELDILEPSLPNNLQDLSDAQENFVEFFKVNEN